MEKPLLSEVQIEIYRAAVNIAKSSEFIAMVNASQLTRVEAREMAVRISVELWNELVKQLRAGDV